MCLYMRTSRSINLGKLYSQFNISMRRVREKAEHMGRRPCRVKEGLNRGAWSVMEGKILSAYINTHGAGKWRDLPQRAGLKRCGKSCRLRWLNYLRPGIKRGDFSTEEDDLIVRMHSLLGNRWALIAGRIPGRTDNEIKNYWNTNLSKRSRFPADKVTEKSGSTNFIKQRKKVMTTRTTSPPDSTHVIRTKAFRCTNPLIPPISLRDHHEDQTMINGKSLARHESQITTSSHLQDHEPNKQQSNSDHDFLMDLEMMNEFLMPADNTLLNSDDVADPAHIASCVIDYGSPFFGDSNLDVDENHQITVSENIMDIDDPLQLIEDVDFDELTKLKHVTSNN